MADIVVAFIAMGAAVFGVALGVVVAWYSRGVNKRSEERNARSEELVNAQVERVRRIEAHWHQTYGQVIVQRTPGESFNAFALNIAPETGHNYHMYISFPEGSKITKMECPGFSVKRGGVDENYVVFFRELLRSGAHATPIKLDVKNEDGTEVTTWEDAWAFCDEDRGFVNIPASLELE